jgi:hypothetical protein
MPRFHRVSYPDGHSERIPFTPEEEIARDVEEVESHTQQTIRHTKRERLKELHVKLGEETITTKEVLEMLKLERG